MLMPGVEHISYAPELSLSASFTTASQSTNKSNVSNETGCLVEEHSRCLQMVTFGVEHISCEPELSRWALHTAASQSTITGMSLTRRNYSLANDTMFSRPPVRLSFSCHFAPSQTWEPELKKCALRAAGTIRGDAVTTFSTRCFKNLMHIEDASGAFDDVCNSASL